MDLYETVRSDLSKGKVDHKSLLEVQALYRDQSMKLMELKKRLEALEAENAAFRQSIDNYKKILEKYNSGSAPRKATNAQTS